MQIRSRRRSSTVAFGVRRVFGFIVVLIGLTLGLNAEAAVHGGLSFYGGHSSSGYHHFTGGHGFHGGHSSFAFGFGLGYYGFYPYLDFGWPYYYPYRYVGYYPAYGYGVNYSAPSISAANTSDPPRESNQATATPTTPPPSPQQVTVINGQSTFSGAMTSANRLFGR